MGRRKRVATPPTMDPKKGRITPPKNTFPTSTNLSNITVSTKVETQPSHSLPSFTSASQRDDTTSPEPTDEESLSDESYISSDQNSQSATDIDSTKQIQNPTSQEIVSTITQNPTVQQPSFKRLPPIFLTTKPEYPWRTIARSLYKIPGHEHIEAKTTSKLNEIKLSCPDEVAFRSVQSFLRSNPDKVGFHTHALPSQRTLKIVIKGIPLDITDEEITEELRLNGFEPTFIRAFSKNGHRIPLHMVTLANIETAKDIYSINKLFFINVKIEPYRSPGPAQCYKCQNFGHSSLQCGHSSRCVKCGETHASNSCVKPLEVTPKCCNCGGAHTANYRGCPFYINLLKQKEPQPRNPKNHENQNKTVTLLTLANPSTRSDNTSPLNHPKATFAEVTSGQKPAIPEPSINVTKVLQIIYKLLASTQECKDPTTKDSIINTIMSIISELPSQNE